MNRQKSIRIAANVLAALTFLFLAVLCGAVGWGLCSALSGCAALPEEPASFTLTVSQDGLSFVPAGAPPAEAGDADAPPAVQPSDSPSPDAAAAPAAPSNADQPTTADGADGVPFSSLSWRFGGFNGAKAVLSSPRIASLSVKASGLSFRWDRGLADWGLADDDASAITAAFVQTSDGSWVGGKFDWISTSRKSRSFENISAGYNGWSLDGCPNPCPFAFLVVSKDGKKRTNVLGPVEWKR